MKKNFLLLILSVFISIAGYGQLTVVPKTTNEGESIISLNGVWSFNPSFKKNLSSVEKPDKNWKSIKVPGEWVMQGFNVAAGEKGTYFRTFELPQSWRNCDVFIRCDAVFSKAEIVINGKLLVPHIGPMIAFEREITSVVKFGRSNKLVIGITSETIPMAGRIKM